MTISPSSQNPCPAGLPVAGESPRPGDASPLAIGAIIYANHDNTTTSLMLARNGQRIDIRADGVEQGAMLREVARRLNVHDELVKALQVYADEKNWQLNGIFDSDYHPADYEGPALALAALALTGEAPSQPKPKPRQSHGTLLQIQADRLRSEQE